MKAIVYTSQTGTTEQYARLLGERTACPVYSLEQALQEVLPGEEILYLGWLMAGGIQGYKKAAARWRIPIVCGVCLGSTGSQLEQVRQRNALPEQTHLFTLQGGFYMDRLHGIYKWMMKMMRKYLTKEITAKAEQTEEDKRILYMLHEGGSNVKEEYLTDVLKIWEERKW